MNIDPISVSIELLQVFNSYKKIIKIVDDVVGKDVFINLRLNGFSIVVSDWYGRIYIAINVIEK